MRNFSENHGPVILPIRMGIDWISCEKDSLQVCKLGAFADFVRVPDNVVADIERVKFLQRCQVVESLNFVVGEPQLLEGRGNVFKILNSLDIISCKRQNFQILKALHRDDLQDAVCRERKLLTVFKLVNLVVQFLERVRQLAHEIHLSCFLR